MSDVAVDEQLYEALVALKNTRSQLNKIKEQLNEPIAIVGMSCRLPGGANSPEEFWNLLRSGKDAITEIPADRWNLAEYYDNNPDAKGKMYSRHGGFLDTPIDQFDASFFNISPREANLLDPQQRLLLEVTYEALENSCLKKNKLRDTKTGVFIGLSSYDYASNIIKWGKDEDIDAYYATGNAASIAAGRLAYWLGLRGPCISVDTACSSSLVALHLACQSLHLNESEMAIVGGVNLILFPDVNIYFCKAKMLAVDGRCKTFDGRADGYVRGEGCGIIVLKKLSSAQRDCDNILAVIRGSAINQDGASGGITVPNGKAQKEVIQAALKNANLGPDEIDYIELHGTGTALGDPIEYNAIAEIFNNHSKPINLGSVKTNIGHLEAAAGIAGLIKVILALQKENLPPHLHLNSVNQHIDLTKIPAHVPQKMTQWSKEAKHTRRAGVSSFGFSGTNAHVIIEEAPSCENIDNSITKSSHIFTFSAKTPNALSELITKYSAYLELHSGLNIADIAFSLNTGRTHFDERMAVIANSQDELLKKLTNHEYLSIHCKYKFLAILAHYTKGSNYKSLTSFFHSRCQKKFFICYKNCHDLSLDIFFKMIQEKIEPIPVNKLTFFYQNDWVGLKY